MPKWKIFYARFICNFFREYFSVLMILTVGKLPFSGEFFGRLSMKNIQNQCMFKIAS